MVIVLKKLLFVFILLLVFVACSNDNEGALDEKTEEDPVEEEVIEEPAEPESTVHIYPLTGLEADEEVTNRMIAVMLNNHPEARPQTGLSHADKVIEILAEGNITRLLAFFQSDIPDRVGPVRSARPYYFHITDDYNGIYVYHGAAQYIEDMIQNGDVEGLNGMYYDNDKVLFERSNDRVAPHNSYTIFDGIYKLAQEKGYALEANYQPPLTFVDDVEIEGDTVANIQFNYGSNYSVSYIYDTQAAGYARYSDGEQTVEYEDNTPIMLENVLFIEANHEVIDDVGRREIDIDSGGDALLLQHGKVQRVQWERNNGRIIPTKEGEPVPFVPGQTWINVIPTNPGIDGVQLSNEAE